MIITYIAHQIGGDVDGNLKDLFRIIRKINLKHRDVLPFAPYVSDVMSLDDNTKSHRERGIKNNIAILKSGVVKQLWLTGPFMSKGMIEEEDLCIKLKIPVFNFIGAL